MNVCFLMGDVITDIKYDFLVWQNKKSIVKFKIKIGKNTKIELRAYDSVADYIYRRNPKKVCVVGDLRRNYVEINEIYGLKAIEIKKEKH